jgi:hypothetical protein
MKKLSIVILIVIGFFVLAVLPVQAKDTGGKGSYNQKSGQTKAMDKSGKWHHNGFPASWKRFCPPDASLTIYVNGATGVDKPRYGLSPQKPFKTINYALQNVTCMRISPEIMATIEVAAGIYDEAVSIGKNLIQLKGAGKESTFITNTTGGDVVTIYDGRGINVSGFTIQGGNRGIFARRGAVFELRDLVVENSGYRGIEVNGNTSGQIVNCTVSGSGFDGIAITGNGSVNFVGNVESNGNGNRGIFLFLSSTSAFLPQSSVVTNNNAGRGIHVGDNSSLFLYSSTLTTSQNGDDGIGVYGNARIAINFGSSVLSDGNADGIGLGDSSSMYASNDSLVETINNSGDGLQLVRSSQAGLWGTFNSTGNGMHGILCAESSNIQLVGISHIEDNGLNLPPRDAGGVHIARSSQGRLSGETYILDNRRHGVGVFKGSGVELERGSIIRISGNELVGVSAWLNSQVSSVAGGTPPADIVISNNGQNGLNIIEGSSCDIREGTAISDHANGSGVIVNQNSQLRFDDVTITNNTGGGVRLDDSSVEIVNSNASGNGGLDINASFGSRLTLNNNNSGLNLGCDGTVLSRGTQVCP